MDKILQAAKAIWSKIDDYTSIVPMARQVSQFQFVDPNAPGPDIDYYADGWEDQLLKWMDVEEKVAVDLSWQEVSDGVFVAYVEQLDVLAVVGYGQHS